MIATLRKDAEPWLRSWGKTSSKAAWVLWLRLLLLTPGFQFVFMLRMQRSLARIPLVGPVLRRMAWYFTTIWFGCDIDPQARIGAGFYTPHPTAIVIGGGVVIGQNVAILQNVTLGRGHRNLEESPNIGDGVEIGCGAAVLGPIRVGANAKIGANSVVLKDVPAGAVAVGSPARLLNQDGNTSGHNAA